MKNRCISKPLFVCLAIAALVLLAAVTASAAPALSIPQEYEQPDGSTFTATLRGDEFFSYLEAEDGSVLIRDEDGSWCYGTADFFVGPMPQGVQSPAPELKASTAQFGSSRKPTGAMTLEQARQAASAATQAANAERMELQAASSASSLGDISLLVILIDFNDTSIQYEEQWAQHVFGTTGKTVKTYFNEATGGKINVVPAQETYGTANDGVIRIKLNMNHPNTDFATDPTDVFAAASRYVDFASYNAPSGHNPNRELHIMFVYAGYEASAYGPTPGVWCYYAGTHMGVGERLLADDMATIGPFCHALGNSLGLPNLYGSGGESELAPGNYSLMANGSWNHLPDELPGTTPALLDAWCLEYLGIISPQTVNLGTITNATVSSWFTCAKNILKVPSGVPNEYFLLECRNKEGFDLALPGERGGVAVYRINTSYWGNYSNNSENGVIMLSLDSIESNHDYGELFFSTRPSGRTFFNANTTPSNKLGDSGGYSWFRFDCLSDSGPSMCIRIQPDKPSDFYAINYNANGGSGGPTVQHKKHGADIIVNDAPGRSSLSRPINFKYAAPTRWGYTFLGWSTSSTATEAQYIFGDTFTANVDTTLYAVWRETVLLPNTPASARVTYNGPRWFFKFVPGVSGEHRLISKFYGEMNVELYNSSMEVLDSRRGYTDVRIPYQLIAGDIYYYAIDFYPNQLMDIDFTVTVNYEGEKPPFVRTIFFTKYPANFINWMLFIFFFGWVWMWL